MAKNDSVEACLEAVRDNLNVIQGCREAIDDILDEAGQSDLITELRAAEKIHPQLVEQLKQAARESGNDRIALGEGQGDIVVSTSRPQVVKDPAGFAEVAKRNGDYDILVSAGVLKIDVDAKQIERLDPRLRARYTEFVSEGQGVTRVLIPASLQTKAEKAT